MTTPESTVDLCEGRKLLKACWDLHGKKADGTCACDHCKRAARWLFASFGYALLGLLEQLLGVRAKEGMAMTPCPKSSP